MAHKHCRIALLFFILTNIKSGDFTPEIIVQSNGTFTLQPDFQGLLEDILWRWDGNKVVEYDQRQVQEYGKFKGRTILNITTGALTLTHLRESDSGEYVGELQIQGVLVHHTQRVKVFDAVDKPSVTCQVHNSSSVTLLCAGGDTPATQYRWEGPAIEPQPGPQLKIETAGSSDSLYTCVLENPVSESRTDFPVKSCFPAEGGSSVMIPLVIVLLIIIIVGLLLLYYNKCYKKRQHEKDTEVQSQGRDGGGVQRSGARGGGAKSRTGEKQDLIGGGAESKAEEEEEEEEEYSQRPGGDSVGEAAHKTPDRGAGVSQERQTEPLNQGEDSEERGVQTEAGNSPDHPSPGTVPSSNPVSPSAAPPKTGTEEDTIHTPQFRQPPPRPPPPHPPKSAPNPAQAPVQSQNQEEETGRGAGAESTDETGANQTAGALRQGEKRGVQDGGSDGVGVQTSGAGGGGAENSREEEDEEEVEGEEEEGHIRGGAENCTEGEEEKGEELIGTERNISRVSLLSVGDQSIHSTSEIDVFYDAQQTLSATDHANTPGQDFRTE